MTLIIISYRTRSIKLTKRSLQQQRASPSPRHTRPSHHIAAAVVRPTIVTSNNPRPSPQYSPAPLLRHFWSTLIDIIYHLFYYFPREWRAEQNTDAAVRWLIKLGYPDLLLREEDGEISRNHPVSKPPPPRLMVHSTRTGISAVRFSCLTRLLYYYYRVLNEISNMTSEHALNTVLQA